MLRWVFHDPAARQADYTVPINPNTMTGPYPPRTLLQDGLPAGRGDGAMLVRAAPIKPFEWTFGGVIHDAAHLAAMRSWYALGGRLNVTDHLGRRWAINILALDAIRAGQTGFPNRFTYTMHVMNYGRV